MEEKETIEVTEDQSRETDSFWDDPRRVLALIDLMFMDEDGRKVIPS